MPYISRAGYSIQNQGVLIIAGSGFTKAGSRIDRYGFLDSRDLPLVSGRFPEQVVSGFIRSGLTYTNNPASGNLFSHTSSTFTPFDDNTCAIKPEHYNQLWSKTHMLVPFNTQEGSGTPYFVNRPVIYGIEKTTLQKNRIYKLWGRNLFQKIDYNIASASTVDGTDGYLPLLYISTTGNPYQLYKCEVYGPDGTTQERHEESWFAYTNILVPTGVPDGRYNLYYYSRQNEASIAVLSGINIFKNIPEPSSTIFRTSDYFTASEFDNRSLQLQNLIYIAASSVLANPNSKADIIFEPKTYLLNNSVVVVSGVNLVGDNTKILISPDLSYERLSSVSIPSRFNGTQLGGQPYYAGIHLTEYCSLKGLHIDIGNERMAPAFGVIISPFLADGGTEISISDCQFHTAFPGDSTTIYSANTTTPVRNVRIEDNEFKGYLIINGYKLGPGTEGHRIGWSIQRNTFTGNCNRAGGGAIGGIGKYCIVANNTISNFLRGIVHSATNGPCAYNLICGNDFSNGGNYFNSSEHLLFENDATVRYNGPVIDILQAHVEIQPQPGLAYLRI